jgi:hyperosmotically inducible periplasmic protein
MRSQFTELPCRILVASLFCSVLVFPGLALGQDLKATPPNPDNSSTNKAHATTSDQQSEATSDRLLTQKIRKSVVADKSLSVYGHNIKIITKDGLVTLKGPVHSDEEKQSIGDKAAQAAGGADKITNQLTVKQ